MCLLYLWTLHESFFFLKIEFTDALNISMEKNIVEFHGCQDKNYFYVNVLFCVILC